MVTIYNAFAIEHLAYARSRFYGHTTPRSNGCIEWLAGRTNGGYGRFKIQIDGRPLEVAAHRAAWVLAGRALDPTLQIDHLCRNPPCVNVDHLELVTPRQNLLRRFGTESHCSHGHERTARNGYVDREGGTHCRPCKRERDNASRRARRAVG